MNKKSLSPGDELAALMKGLNNEVDDELRAAMSPSDQKMDEISREILRLERDMTVPGNTLAESARIERLMSFIKEREF